MIMGGIVHPVRSGFDFSLRISFWEGSYAPKLTNVPRKKVVHLYRSTRHICPAFTKRENCPLQQHYNNSTTAAAALQQHYNSTATAQQQHYNNTTTALQQHYNSTSTALQQHIHIRRSGFSASFRAPDQSRRSSTCRNPIVRDLENILLGQILRPIRLRAKVDCRKSSI